MPSDAHVEFVLVSARVGCSLGIALGIQISLGSLVPRQPVLLCLI